MQPPASSAAASGVLHAAQSSSSSSSSSSQLLVQQAAARRASMMHAAPASSPRMRYGATDATSMRGAHAVSGQRSYAGDVDAVYGDDGVDHDHDDDDDDDVDGGRRVHEAAQGNARAASYGGDYGGGGRSAAGARDRHSTVGGDEEDEGGDEEEDDEGEYDDDDAYGPERLEDRRYDEEWMEGDVEYTVAAGTKLLVFRPVSSLDDVPYAPSPLPTQLMFRFYRTGNKIIKVTFEEHGFRETNTNDFDVMWAGCHLQPSDLQALRPYQHVNHFPRTAEITRKDRLSVNIKRMQQLHGIRHFDFLPDAYCLPHDMHRFHSTSSRDRSAVWIVKPNASSRGRGIFLTHRAADVPRDRPCLVSRYITNPLLVDGFKFDLRIYVAITSFDPLRVYVYREGLARFCTEKYSRDVRNLDNLFMHLTNYSINKYSSAFVQNEDPEIDNFGNKWSLSALWEYLRDADIDVDSLWQSIVDLIIKTILSAETHIYSATKMFVPHQNCFELLGFDVLIDDALQPWLMEVNLCPSLACESPLDLKIKSHLIADLFNLVGVPLHRRRASASANSTRRYMSSSAGNVGPETHRDSFQRRMLLDTLWEYARRGGFDRVYPDVDTHKYDVFFETPRHSNQLLHKALFSSPMTMPDIPARMRVFALRRVRSVYTASTPAAQAPPATAARRSSQQTLPIAAAVTNGMSSLSTAPAPASASATAAGTSAAARASVPALRQTRLGRVVDAQPASAGSSSARSAGDDAMDLPSSGAQAAQAMSANGVLDPIQARDTFVSYLDRVRLRLLDGLQQGLFSHADAGGSSSEQSRLDLVEQFIQKVQRRNVGLLAQHGVEPMSGTKRFAPAQRASMLAQTLERFVAIYADETQRIARQLRAGAA